MIKNNKKDKNNLMLSGVSVNSTQKQHTSPKQPLPYGKMTLTTKIKLIPSNDNIALIKETINAYTLACNYISKIVFDSKSTNSELPQLNRRL
jgi:flagellar basal body rod protein FlgB